MELENCAAACALQDGCRTLGVSNEAAAELLKFLICKSKHEQLQGLPSQQMFPSSKLAALLQWACDNLQVNCTGSLCRPARLPLTHHMALNTPVQSFLSPGAAAVCLLL